MPVTTEHSTSVEHQNVPQVHRGLHDFLYSSEDEHSVAMNATPLTDFMSDSPVNIEAWCTETAEVKIAGVYAVLNGNRQTQYIGYSRNVALSLKSHLTQLGPETCAFVKVQLFKFPKREKMEQIRDKWIAALPQTPPGNRDSSGAWAGTMRDASRQAMSEVERQAYEEKKLKLQRAMADGILNQEEFQLQNDAKRRQALESAIEDNNWSEVIREQTQETKSL